jgi:hypothetical protein
MNDLVYINKWSTSAFMKATVKYCRNGIHPCLCLIFLGSIIPCFLLSTPQQNKCKLTKWYWIQLPTTFECHKERSIISKHVGLFIPMTMINMLEEPYHTRILGIYQDLIALKKEKVVVDEIYSAVIKLYESTQISLL